ncbi:uncharacterized protein ACA1_324900 [Acanthamoeba castellanii str. Neff]|uniref:Uncharacterized protein n=1 Tax=Acanthamoeba castellanii (strain ATCC 30010 / Neff) TaxID=1257118 RepID=L8GI61_ACACF|nr:uncharacterized protein ACA1_324900 [Acanthamoeba castellanii str. Neff]ELR12443.1 hypothetical protein ACA1_324900 [Acanthamoeba castellanii str. Neff]
MGSRFFCLAHRKSVKGLELGATTRTAVEVGQGPISYMTKDACTWSLNYGESERHFAELSIRENCGGNSECVLDFLQLVDAIERDAERMPLRPLLRGDFADAVTTKCQVILTRDLRRDIEHAKLCINLEKIVDGRQGDDLLKGAAYEHCGYHHQRPEGRLWRIKNALADDPGVNTEQLRCISTMVEKSH